MEINKNLEAGWKKVLQNEFQKEYFHNIVNTISQDIEKSETLYPPIPLIFNAFNHTPFDKIKVVILWQDPYHGEWQAHGLCFSVPEWVKAPPSLKNIFKEIKNDIGLEIKDTWCLEQWSSQWVFMLNAILTVKAGKPASHSKIWWEQFTDSVIKTISDKKEWVVFLLWWAFAQSKKSLIDDSKHTILETTHPSPFSAYRWFLGSHCFSETNKALKKMGKKEIDWKI